MVFSRYVTVLRGAGNVLRSNLLEAKHNPKSRHSRADFRTCKNLRVRVQPEISQNTSEAVPVPSTSHDVPTVKPKILGFVSPAPSGYDSEVSDVNTAGNKNVIPDEILTESDLNGIRGLPGALETCTEDISYLAPYHRPSFNFAAYANNSPTIQELAKLGVGLYKIEEKPGAMAVLLRYNFEEMKPYIRFLHDTGVPAESIGAFITENPFIFTQDMDDLHTRIRYLRAHKFSRDNIARIVTKNTFWLMYNTKRIDTRLGYFQKEFQLNGSQVRHVAQAQPRLITFKLRQVAENTFAFREEMGFNKHEVQAILLERAGLFMKSRKKIVAVFDYLHNKMNLSHETLSKQPMILTCRLERLRNRHEYLELLGKNQYDPTKPLYVSLNAIVGGTDVDFCRDVAKTAVDTYNVFLKSR